MNELFVGLAAQCTVQIVEIEVEPSPTGWTEELHLEVAVAHAPPSLEPPCPTITLPLPPGAKWTRHRGHTQRRDGTRDRLHDARFVTTSPAVDRSRRTVVHVPELREGDRVILNLTRSLVHGPLRYTDLRANYLRLASPAAVEAPDTLQRDAKRNSVWGRDVTDVALTVTTPTATTVGPTPFDPAPSSTLLEARSTLRVAEGRDPMVALYPGSGASFVDHELFVTVPPREEAVAWIVPAPVGVSVDVDVSTKRAEVNEAFGIHRLEVPPSEGPTRVRLAWTTPDAPTYGAVPTSLGPGSPGHIASWEVDAIGGDVRWNSNRTAWTLCSIGGAPVVPDRDAFVRALNNRFVRLGNPEPGLPGPLRGRRATPELAGELAEVLRARVGSGAGTTTLYGHASSTEHGDPGRSLRPKLR